MDAMFTPYRRYADFSGRATRREYWMFFLFVALVSVVLFVLMLAGGFSLDRTASADTAAPGGPLFYVGVIGLAIFWLGTFIPNLAVTVRRFHDRDMSGWWVLGFALLGNIPYIGWMFSIAQLVILALPGTAGHNRFGEDPLDPMHAKVFA